MQTRFNTMHYNQSYGGVDRHDTFALRQQQFVPEDVLR